MNFLGVLLLSALWHVNIKLCAILTDRWDVHRQHLWLWGGKCTLHWSSMRLDWLEIMFFKSSSPYNKVWPHPCLGKQHIGAFPEYCVYTVDVNNGATKKILKHKKSTCMSQQPYVPTYLRFLFSLVLFVWLKESETKGLASTSSTLTGTLFLYWLFKMTHSFICSLIHLLWSASKKSYGGMGSQWRVMWEHKT